MREVRQKLRATAEALRRQLGVALDITSRLAIAFVQRRRFPVTHAGGRAGDLGRETLRVGSP